MGVYLYAISKTGKFDAELNGVMKKIFPMKFKAVISTEYEQKQKTVYCAIDAARKAILSPEYSGIVAMLNRHGSDKEGAEVYRLHPRRYSWVDSKDFPGELIGNLRKVGRKWIVVPLVPKKDDDASRKESQ